MKLWLDDLRTPPDDSWTWVKTPAEAYAALSTGTVEIASLDHDLGIDPVLWEDYTTGKVSEDDAEMTGYQVALWMAEHDVWPTEAIYCHSANPVGVKNITGVVDRYGPYTSPCRYVDYMDYFR